LGRLCAARPAGGVACGRAAGAAARGACGPARAGGPSGAGAAGPRSAGGPAEAMPELSPHEELLGQKSRDGERRLGEPDALLLDRASGCCGAAGGGCAGRARASARILALLQGGYKLKGQTQS